MMNELANIKNRLDLISQTIDQGLKEISEFGRPQGEFGERIRRMAEALEKASGYLEDARPELEIISQIVEEEKTSSDYKQFQEFGGVIDLDIGCRIPSSYYEALKEYCRLINIPVREWCNTAIVLEIEAIELGPVTNTFLERYHLRSLSKEKREAIIQAHRMFTLKEQRLNDG
jgi:hypothetical protein